MGSVSEYLYSHILYLKRTIIILPFSTTYGITYTSIFKQDEVANLARVTHRKKKKDDFGFSKKEKMNILMNSYVLDCMIASIVFKVDPVDQRERERDHLQWDPEGMWRRSCGGWVSVWVRQSMFPYPCMLNMQQHHQTIV